MSQESEIEYIGTNEPGYTRVRSARVKELLEFFKEPEVCFSYSTCFSQITSFIFTLSFSHLSIFVSRGPITSVDGATTLTKVDLRRIGIYGVIEMETRSELHAR